MAGNIATPLFNQFSDQFRTTPEDIQTSPLVDFLIQWAESQRRKATSRSKAATTGSGFGQSTFTDLLSNQAGVQAQQPFQQQIASEGQRLEQRGFDLSKIGLQEDIFRNRLEEEERRKREEEDRNFLNNLLFGGLGAGASAISGGGVGDLFSLLLPNNAPNTEAQGIRSGEASRVQFGGGA